MVIREGRVEIKGILIFDGNIWNDGLRLAWANFTSELFSMRHKASFYYLKDNEMDLFLMKWIFVSVFVSVFNWHKIY